MNYETQIFGSEVFTVKHKTTIFTLSLILLLALALLPAAALADETPEYAWTIAPEGLTFTVAEGYEGAPSQEINAVSTGTEELTFIMAGYKDAASQEIFEYSVGNMTATVSPKPGLAIGTHTGYLVISEWEDRVAETEIPITVIVTEGPSPYPTMTELKITAPPTKLSYKEGESFDYDGLALTAVYSDGSEKDVTDGPLEMRVNDPLTAADTQVTFVYTDENNYTREAVQPITVTEDPNRPSAAFTDVPADAWFRFYVDYAVENGLMYGTATDKFEPNTPLTRAMLVTILYRLEGEPTVEGEPPFSDVAARQWYIYPVIWAKNNNVVAGYPDGTFHPNDIVTREQFAAFLYRYAQLKGCDVSGGEGFTIDFYKDAAKISGWALPAMKWACSSALILGDDDLNLMPLKGANRAETAAILMRFTESFEPAEVTPAEVVTIALEQRFKEAYGDAVEEVVPSAIKIYTAEEIAASEALAAYEIGGNDIVFEAAYDLKIAEGVADKTQFAAGNGEIDGQWVRNKHSLGIVKDNGNGTYTIDAFGTGW